MWEKTFHLESYYLGNDDKIEIDLRGRSTIGSDMLV